ncbi:MAG TPA: hypothetical protein VJN18_01390 [Polyangiaceae bacterium]|nr:hypothetical protein [Polyangiaceae bacterium]
MALGLATFETDLDGALELGGRALTLAESSGRPLLVGAAFEADALVLGALQREDTLRQRSPARFDVPIARRLTTGTEAQLRGPTLYHALALPHVAALFPDASSRTLLNRNLRALLRGYTAAGVPLRYFGTEVLVLLGHPVALVGYDQSTSGAVLIEVLLGLETASVVRPALKREPPAALYGLLRGRPVPRDLLERAQRGVVERLGVASHDVTSELPSVARVERDRDLGHGAVAPIEIPLGVVEASIEPRARVTGDLLVSTAAVREVELAADAAFAPGASLTSSGILTALDGVPLDGARASDVLAAFERASQGLY